MTLQHAIQFDTARETTDGRGWKYTHWEDTDSPIVTTEERLYRMDKPTGGALSATKTVNNKVLTSNVATLTTSTSHGFVVDDVVTVALSPADAVFDGTYIVSAVGDATHFSYAKTNANVSTVAATGTAASQPSVIERLKAVASLDPIMRTYYLTKAQTTVLAANAAAVTTAQNAGITAEGLLP